ncbi:MAG: NAD(P)H-binding protein [Bdellovibrionota bacterium]|nr:MAG: NAD-dependent epimerase/dehydratase family protein [Pseudomonadota bacterium]
MKAKGKAKQILVVGSAGFIGKALMRKLSKDGRSAYSLYHTHLPEPLTHITPIFADLLKPEQLETMVRQSDEVIYLAWSNPLRSLKAQAAPNNDSPNILMLRNLVHAMEQQGSRRIIFVSSLGASRFAESHYLKEKYMAESVIINSNIPEKILLRSPILYSDLNAKDKFVQSIESLMTMPWVYPIPKLTDKITPMHVNDLVETLIKLIEVPLPTPVQLIELIGKESLALDEIFKSVSQGIGKSHHVALKGFIGDALTPLFEKLHGRKRFEGPSLRDMLTVATAKRDADGDSPINEKLPSVAHSFDQAMGRSKNNTPELN